MDALALCVFLKSFADENLMTQPPLCPKSKGATDGREPIIHRWVQRVISLTTHLLTTEHLMLLHRNVMTSNQNMVMLLIF